MPYIRQEDRTKCRNGGPENVGELTYELQQTIKDYLLYKGLRYQYIAEIKGALDETRRDFEKRVVDPYEQKKLEDNGDVWPEELLV